MLVPRAAFLLTVHRRDAPAVLENLRTRERTRIDDLAEIPAQLERWLASQPAEDVDEPPLTIR
jgi:hypothetical protein